jgi:hypothetical protein
MKRGYKQIRGAYALPRYRSIVSCGESNFSQEKTVLLSQLMGLYTTYS